MDFLLDKRDFIYDGGMRFIIFSQTKYGEQIYIEYLSFVFRFPGIQHFMVQISHLGDPALAFSVFFPLLLGILRHCRVVIKLISYHFEKNQV